MSDMAIRALEAAIEQAWHEYHGPIHMEGQDDYFPALPPLFKRGFVEGVKHAKRERDEARRLKPSVASQISKLKTGISAMRQQLAGQEVAA
jgi:hypothetical protein